MQFSEAALSKLAECFLHVICGRYSFFLWRRCDTLCTSGFVDDVKIVHSRPGIGDYDADKDVNILKVT